MFPIVRMYETQQQARAAAQALADEGLPPDAIFVVSSDTGGAETSGMPAALKAGYALGGHPGFFSSENAEACARGLQQGRSLVGVSVPFGSGQKVIDLLEGFQPVESEQVSPPIRKKVYQQEHGAPLSSFLGLPLLSRDPAPVSDFLGLPPLSKGLSFLSRGYDPSKKSRYSLSSLLGMKLLSRNPAPLSSRFGMKTLSTNPSPGNRSFGLPLLSRKAAPLSSTVGLPTLSRRKKEWKTSFGLPLLIDE